MKPLGVLFALFLSIFLTFARTSLGDSQPEKAPDRGENVCAYTKIKSRFVLRQNKSTIRDSVTKDCGLKAFPGLQCNEESYVTKIYYYPVRKNLEFKTYDCCPGWRGYQAGVGCTEAIACGVSIPQKSQKHCRKERMEGLHKMKLTYKLGHIKNLPFPLLTMEPMKLMAMYYSDPFSKLWMELYIYMLKKNLALIQEFPKKNKKEFTSVADYKALSEFFIEQQQNNPKVKPFFRLPSLEEPFKSVVNNVTWREDRVFVEQRLAGLNPMSLVKVSADEESVGVKLSALETRLNPNFEWNSALERALGREMTVEQAIEEGILFTSYYPVLDKLTTYPDITEPRPSRKMWKSMSPLALFVSSSQENGGPAQLKPVAIQLDYTPDSAVYTPADGDLWSIAKESFQVADYAYVEMVEHLLYTHLMMEPFCVCAKRHLSTLHPVQELLNYHCRGLLPTNKIGFPKLVDDKAYMHQLFAIGNIGAVTLLVRAYHNVNWARTDFRGNLKSRGVDDKTKLPYFPYRDDGEVLFSAIEAMVEEYVQHYYPKDSDVRADTEIQAFVNEMSAEGTGKDGGQGKLKGFPPILKTKKDLSDVVARLIWTASGQHTAVNYPIAAYGAFTPNMPTKVYDDARDKPDEFNVFRLPNANVAAVQAGVAMSLGSLRLDRLLDYGKHLQDKAGGEIVLKHFQHLHEEVKPLLDKRNQKRLQEGYLTYPFLSPAWVPNSIAT